MADERRSLLSSQARVMTPYIKVTIGTYTFGVFSKTANKIKDDAGFYSAYDVQYPNYITGLSVTKINGQVNQYTLTITYGITQNDDPNFFEKVFSSISSDRKIIFSYGDCSMPSYIYKDEEAVVTKVSQTFNLQSSQIVYTVSATSTIALSASGNYTFPGQTAKPSKVIETLYTAPNDHYGLRALFPGMADSTVRANLIKLDEDKAVKIQQKVGISVLDYLTYLVSCMTPYGSNNNSTLNTDIFTLTLHDETSYDKVYNEVPTINGKKITGSYFKVSRTNHLVNSTDAYVIDVGYNTSTIVTQFSTEQNENYALYYDYQNKLGDTGYVKRLTNTGEWETVYSPSILSKNANLIARQNDKTWWTNVTQYPIKATITIKGLLRPALLMQHVRLNILFPGGHKHITSGLYLITKQIDTINATGYQTQLGLTKISGDNNLGD